MGRFLLGVGILLGFLGLCLGIAGFASATHAPIAQTLEEAAQASLAGDLSQGAVLAQKAQTAWEKHWPVSAAVSDHGPMDEIDGLFAQLEVWSKSQRFADFSATCTRLAQLVQAMIDAHKPAWWNLL